MPCDSFAPFGDKSIWKDEISILVVRFALCLRQDFGRRALATQTNKPGFTNSIDFIDSKQSVKLSEYDGLMRDFKERIRYEHTFRGRENKDQGYWLEANVKAPLIGTSKAILWIAVTQLPKVLNCSYHADNPPQKPARGHQQCQVLQSLCCCWRGTLPIF